MTTDVEPIRSLGVVALSRVGDCILGRLLRFSVAARSLLAKASSQEVESWQLRVSSSRD